MYGNIQMAMNVEDEQEQNAQGTKLADRLLQIGKDCAANLKEPYRSMDHGEILYGDRGLPLPRG
jgi:antitoxin VapB